MLLKMIGGFIKKDYSMDVWRKSFICAYRAFLDTGYWKGQETEKAAEKADMAVIEYKKRLDNDKR